MLLCMYRGTLLERACIETGRKGFADLLLRPFRPNNLAYWHIGLLAYWAMGVLAYWHIVGGEMRRGLVGKDLHISDEGLTAQCWMFLGRCCAAARGNCLCIFNHRAEQFEYSLRMHFHSASSCIKHRHPALPQGKEMGVSKWHHHVEQIRANRDIICYPISYANQP